MLPAFAGNRRAVFDLLPRVPGHETGEFDKCGAVDIRVGRI